MSREQSQHSRFCSVPISVSHLPAPSDDFADDLESYMVAMETGEGDSERAPSPTFPLHTPWPAQREPEEEKEEEGAVPGTPPHKKVRDGCAWGQGVGRASS